MKKPKAEFDREFEHYLQRISRFLRKIILRSDEFRELRVLLKQGKAEMRLFLVPVLVQAGANEPGIRVIERTLRLPILVRPGRRDDLVKFACKIAKVCSWQDSFSSCVDFLVHRR